MHDFEANKLHNTVRWRELHCYETNMMCLDIDTILPLDLKFPEY